MNAIRTGLLLLLAFSVLAFGAVEVWAESIVETGAAALLIAWIVMVLTHPGLKVEWMPLV